MVRGGWTDEKERACQDLLNQIVQNNPDNPVEALESFKPKPAFESNPIFSESGYTQTAFATKYNALKKAKISELAMGAGISGRTAVGDLSSGLGNGIGLLAGAEILGNDERSIHFPTLIASTADTEGNQILHVAVMLFSGTEASDVSVEVSAGGTQLVIAYNWADEFLQLPVLGLCIPELNQKGHSLQVAFSKAIRAIKTDSVDQRIKATYRIPLPFQVEEQLYSCLGHDGYELRLIPDKQLKLLFASMIEVRKSSYSAKKKTKFKTAGSIASIDGRAFANAHGDFSHGIAGAVNHAVPSEPMHDRSQVQAQLNSHGAALSQITQALTELHMSVARMATGPGANAPPPTERMQQEFAAYQQQQRMAAQQLAAQQQAAEEQAAQQRAAQQQAAQQQAAQQQAAQQHFQQQHGVARQLHWQTQQNSAGLQQDGNSQFHPLEIVEMQETSNGTNADDIDSNLTEL